MASKDWASWLSRATERVHALLAARNDGELAALGARCPEASPAELKKVRALVKRIGRALDGGDGNEWRRLALALDVVEVGGPARDDEPPMRGVDDGTLPAGQAPPPEIAVAPAMPVTGETLVGAPATTQPSPVAAPGRATGNKGGTIRMQAIATGTAAPESAPSSVLDIEKYAVLCAWTEVHPQRREQLHRQYGLVSEDERARLDRDFAGLFQRDARMRAAFEKRLQLHLGFLRGGAR